MHISWPFLSSSVKSASFLQNALCMRVCERAFKCEHELLSVSKMTDASSQPSSFHTAHTSHFLFHLPLLHMLSIIARLALPAAPVSLTVSLRLFKMTGNVQYTRCTTSPELSLSAGALTKYEYQAQDERCLVVFPPLLCCHYLYKGVQLAGPCRAGSCWLLTGMTMQPSVNNMDNRQQPENERPVPLCTGLFSAGLWQQQSACFPVINQVNLRDTPILNRLGCFCSQIP